MQIKFEVYLIHLERDGENGRKDQISVWFLVWDDLTEAKLEFVGRCQLQF